MNKYQIKYFSIAVVILVAISSLFYFAYKNNANQNDTHPKLTFNQSDIALVKTLKASDGTILGDVNVTNLHSASADPSLGRNLNDVFTALYVTKEVGGKDIILYKINSEGFFNTIGKEMETSKDNFYGFQFALIAEDHFVLHGLADNGKSVSDDVTIVWNPDKNVFEIYRIQEPGPENIPTTIASLDLLGSPQFGKVEVYVSYLDKDKNVLKSLGVSSESRGLSRNIYFINEDGFFTPNGKKDLEIAKGDFHGFKLDLVKDDYFIVHLLAANGQSAPDKITVRWNYDKKIFEVQKTP